MNRTEAKDFYHILQAFSEGKTIECRTKPSVLHKSWQDMNNWTEMKEFVFLNNTEYRIKPKYRPFKDAKECWQEMLKHQPFGWITNTDIERSKMIDIFDSSEDDNDRPIRINESWWKLSQVFEKFTFADGTPFGIKVEE